MSETKVKLPQDLITCPLSELETYINAHLPGGHKRKLAEAVLSLRKHSAAKERVAAKVKAKDAA